MLKFERNIEECLKQFTERKKWNPESSFRIEYEFLKTLLINGDKAFNAYAIALQKSLPKEEIIRLHREILKKQKDIRDDYIYKEDILQLLKKNGINTQEKRGTYIAQVNELGELFLKMADGDVESYKLFCDKYQKYVFEEGKNNFFSKQIPNGIIIYIFEISEKLKEIKSGYKQIESMPFSYFKYLITDFQYYIGVGLGLRKKKNALDILEDAKLIVSNISDDENLESGSENVEENELEKLRFERDNFKSSLQFIQNNFNELKEKIEEEASEAKKLSISEFFTTLNSEKYGKFLDKVPYAEELLVKIRKGHLDKDVPQEIKTIMMFIKQVIKFIKDSGIEPIEEYNRIFTGTADDIAHMSYNGEPFFGDHEVKELKIGSPGYRYKDITISIPTVSEVER